MSGNNHGYHTKSSVENGISNNGYHLTVDTSGNHGNISACEAIMNNNRSGSKGSNIEVSTAVL